MPILTVLYSGTNVILAKFLEVKLELILFPKIYAAHFINLVVYDYRNLPLQKSINLARNVLIENFKMKGFQLFQRELNIF